MPSNFTVQLDRTKPEGLYMAQWDYIRRKGGEWSDEWFTHDHWLGVISFEEDIMLDDDYTVFGTYTDGCDTGLYSVFALRYPHPIEYLDDDTIMYDPAREPYVLMITGYGMIAFYARFDSLDSLNSALELLVDSKSMSDVHGSIMLQPYEL